METLIFDNTVTSRIHQATWPDSDYRILEAGIQNVTSLNSSPNEPGNRASVKLQLSGKKTKTMSIEELHNFYVDKKSKQFKIFQTSIQPSIQIETPAKKSEDLSFKKAENNYYPCACKK